MKRSFACVVLVGIGLAFACQSGQQPQVRGLHLSQVQDAQDWFLAMRSFPQGIPPGARVKALANAAQLDGGVKRSGFRTLHPEVTGSSSWFPIGPTPVGQWSGTSISTSGRATVIAPNPANPSEVWLGTATGGVWHTLNAQSTDPDWVPVDGLQFADGLPGPNGVVPAGAMAMSIGSLAPDGCNASGCQTVWIGTGEDGIRRDTYYGAGLFKLTQETTQLKHHMTDPLLYLLTQAWDFRYGSVVAIALPPHALGTEAGKIYVAVSSGTAGPGSEESSTAPTPSTGYGIFASTNGTTFTKLPIPGNGIGGSLPTDVKVDPNDSSGNTILVGFMAKDPTDTTAVRGILKGINGGASASDWCSFNQNAGIPLCAGSNAASSCTPTSGLPPGNCVVANPPVNGIDEVLGYVTLAYSPNPGGSNRLYARIGQCGQRADYGCTSTAVYASNDDGATWNPLNLSVQTPSYDRYTHALTVVPASSSSSEQLVVGGVDLMSCPTTPGATCAFIDVNGQNDLLHGDHHAVVFPDPTNPNLAYDANDGGFFFTTTGFAGWTAGNTTLTTNQVDSLGVLDHNVVVGLQDNGQAYFNGSRQWTWFGAGGGDGGGVLGYQFGSPAQSVWFTESQRGALFRTNNDPTSPNNIHPLSDFFPASAAPKFVNNPTPSCQNNQCFYTGNAGQFTQGSCTTQSDCPIPASQCAFFAPLAMNRSSHDLYIASTEIYQSAPTTDDANRGSSPWSTISPVLATPSGSLFATIDTDNVITALGVGDDGAVYAGTYIGEVWVSQSPCASTACWFKAAGPGSSNTSPPMLPVSSIEVTHGDSSTAYVTYSGFGTNDHVWKVTSYGHTWATLSGGLMDAPANVIRFDALGNLWLGTDIGIYSLSGGTWTRDTSLPFVPVMDIASEQAEGNTQRVYAGTHGRGVWTLTNPTVYTLEGWSSGTIWDVPVHGYGFPNGTSGNVSCTISLVQQSGNVCASGSIAVNTDNPGGNVPGGPIHVDSTGMLQTDAASTYPQGGNNVPVVWACKEGTCLNNTPIQKCNQDSSGNSDELSTVIVDCGVAGKGQTRILNAPALGNPPSSALLFDPPLPPTGPTWTYEAVVSLTSPSGAILLCRAPVTFSQQASATEMVSATALALDTSADCQAAGVSAVVNPERAPSNPEDPEDGAPPVLSVQAPSQFGSEVFVTFKSAPSLADGLCFTLAGLGNPALHQSAIMQTLVSTAESGAAGGFVRFVETTDIGQCQQDVTTTPGMTATQIAAAIGQAFDGVTSPGAANCLARADALDLQVSGAYIFSVTAQTMQVCSFDQGVGFTTTPDTVQVPNLPPSCNAVSPSPDMLWPPDHQFVAVNLTGAIDLDGDPVTLTVTQVRQDENPNGQTDAELLNGTLYLRSERDGNGDGRLYHVQFSASDGQGGTCTGEVTVCVPHDQGLGPNCVDEGALYPSGIP